MIIFYHSLLQLEYAKIRNQGVRAIIPYKSFYLKNTAPIYHIQILLSGKPIKPLDYTYWGEKEKRYRDNDIRTLKNALKLALIF